MQKYKQFINPKIKEYLKEKINGADGFIFIECALLIEDGLDKLVDSIIMIYCKKETQIKRLQDGDLGRAEEKKELDDFFDKLMNAPEEKE